MRTKKMIIDTKLSIVEYMWMVEAMVSEYFGDDGTYQPQIGLLNIMRLFYNKCVMQSHFDTEHEHNITDPMDLEEIISDNEFILEFNNAIEYNPMKTLDFGNAYYDAMDIVDVRKTSLSQAVQSMKSAVESIIDEIRPMMSESNIKNTSMIAELISSGKFDPDKLGESIVNAYGKSQRFQEVINKPHETNSAKYGKVIPFKK